MKTFKDSTNVIWTVFEVRRQAVSRADGAFLPSGFNDGWLCFECAVAKKRLVKYPERWRELTDGELEKLLIAAQPAPRTTFKLSEDFSDSPTREL
ncbi:MAG TPA: hypothetical protein VEB19_14000 [Gemmatimonadaceae bacterium]|nr:hypothetical protein [Gemmatimonadaceae bacterium]